MKICAWPKARQPRESRERHRRGRRIRAQLESIDNVPVGGTPAEFAKEIARATEQNRRLVETGGISTE